MPNRREQMLEYSATIFAEKAEIRFRSMYEYYRQNKKAITQEYLDKYNQIFTETIQRQKAGQKQPIQWIITSYLRSSIVTGQPKLHIGLYDANYLLDQTEIHGYWPIGFLLQLMQDDIIYLTQQLKKRFVRVMKYEDKEISQYYIQLLIFTIAERIHTELLPQLIKLSSYQDMDKTMPIHFIYGEYLDQGKTVYTQEREEENGILPAQSR